MPATKTKLTANKEPLSIIRKMPENATLAKIREELAISAAINEGIAELDAGLGIPPAEVVKRAKTWRTK